MVSQWSLSDNKSPQVSRTLLSILVDLNVVVWIISISPLISKASRPFTIPLGIVSSAQTTIGMTVNLMFYGFTSIISIIFLLESFSLQRYLMVFHWSLSDNKSPRVSWTHLSILTDLNDAVVWTVSTCPVMSKSSSLCTNSLVTIPRVPTTIDIIVTFMFHCFFISLARSRYLSLFSLSFNFTLWSAGITKSTILKVCLSL